MHLVGFAFEPAEVALHAIPGARPFVFFIAAVVWIAVDHESLMLRRKVLRMARSSACLRALHMRVRSRCDSSPWPDLPRFHRAASQCLRAIGNGAVVINRDGASETSAGRTGAERMIETEHRRRRLAIIDVARRAMKSVGKESWIRRQSARIDFKNRQLAFAKMKRLLAAFDEARAVFCDELQAILNDGDERNVECECRIGQELLRCGAGAPLSSSADNLASQSGRAIRQRKVFPRGQDQT